MDEGFIIVQNYANLIIEYFSYYFIRFEKSNAN